MTDMKETRESGTRTGCAASEPSSWLYVSTSLDILFLPNASPWRLPAIYSRPTLSSRPVPYYRLTADVLAWIVSRILTLDTKSARNPKLAAGLRELAPAFEEIMAWTYATLDRGEIAAALTKPPAELKLPVVEKFLDFDNSAHESKPSEGNEEACEGETASSREKQPPKVRESVWVPARTKERTRKPNPAKLKRKPPRAEATPGGLF